MEITKMLTISTAHVSKSTATKLDYEAVENNMLLSVYLKADYGWLVYCNTSLSEKDIPNDLLKCLIFAKDLGCDWLCLDCDGEEVDDLEVYDW